MRHKKLVVCGVIVLVSFLAVVAFLASSNPALQAINPLAALTAVTVAVLGFAWFKKSSG
jgi:hypothetical protein